MDLLVDRSYVTKHFMVDVSKGKSEWEFVVPSKIIFYDDELGVKLAVYDNGWTSANITDFSIETSNDFKPLRLKRKVDYRSKEPYFMNGGKSYFGGNCEKLIYIPASKVTITDMGYDLIRSTEEGYEGFPQRVIRYCKVKELNLRIEETLFNVDQDLLKIRAKWNDTINSLSKFRSIDDMDELEEHVKELKSIKKQHDLKREYYKDFTLQNWFENVSCEDIDENGMVACKMCSKTHVHVKHGVWLAPHYFVCKHCYSEITEEELAAIWKQHYNSETN